MMRVLYPAIIYSAITFCVTTLYSDKSQANTGDESLRSTRNFDIPEQALQTSLIEFALQADITIIANNELLKGLRSNTLSGPLSLESALTQLIGSAPLAFQYQADTQNYIVIAKTPSSSTIAAAPLAVEEVVITGVRFPFLYNTITNSQQQSSTSNYDASRFLNVIPQSLIQDQQASDLNDVLKYASGITPGDGLSDSNDDLFIRGFQRHAIYVDGFRLGDSTGIKIFPANTERVEILKGPSTLHYGQAEPGGIVNVVRKKPQDDSFVRAEFGAGTLGKKFANLDINGKLPTESNIDVRLVLADDQQDKAGELSDLDKQLIAPSLTWKVSDNTSVDLSYEYQSATQTWARNFLVFKPYEDIFPGATLGDVSKNAHPDFNTKFNLYHAELNHYFNSDWHLTAKYFWQQEDRLGIRTSAEALMHSDTLIKSEELGKDFILLMPGSEVVLPIIWHNPYTNLQYSVGKIRSLYDETARETENNFILNLDGNLIVGSTTHHLLAGGDWHRQDIYKKYTVETRDLFTGQLWTPDEFNAELPYIASVIFDQSQPLGALNNKDLGLIYDDFGGYIQDNIEFNDQWLASIGTRYSVITGEYTDFDNKIVTELKTYKKFSSQLGLVYKPNENHSIFANYSQALRANYQIDQLGANPAEPELSNQIELGLKSQFWDGRLLSTIAVFDINKKNIMDLKFVDGIRTLLAAHEQEVRGIDLDITAQLSSKLNVIGALSIIDPKITSGENSGKKPMLAADQTASLFANYFITKNVSVNSGLHYVSKRFGDNGNQFWLNPYTTWDAGFAYRFKLFSNESKLQISAKNLLDTKYYTALLSGVRMNESDGRTLVASLKVEL
jgi:TonB-dependent siderophore receptor